MYLFLISTKALSLAVYLFDHSVSLELNWLIDFAEWKEGEGLFLTIFENNLNIFCTHNFRKKKNQTTPRIWTGLANGNNEL